MTPEVFEQVFEQWKIKELKNVEQKKRRYLHFDNSIQFQNNIESFKNYFLQSEKKVTTHSFYPFIKSDILSPRIKQKRDPNTNKKFFVKEIKPRPICYASHFDSYIYSWYSDILTFHYKEIIKKIGIEECVLAYLAKSKSNIDFAKEVFGFVSTVCQNDNQCVALAFDLKSFFDGIDHELLKTKWCEVLGISNSRLPKDHFTVYKSLTNYSFIQKEEIETHFPIPVGAGYKINRICSPKQFRDATTGHKLIGKNPFINSNKSSKRFGEMCGIPQGSPISACLSNIYMLDFDFQIQEEVKKKGAYYRRYCDDLIVICKYDDWTFFKELIEKSILNSEVGVNESKTEIIFFKQDSKRLLRGFSESGDYRNLQYLGFEFNGQNTFIRSSSMSRYSRKMLSKVKQTIDDAYCEDFGQQNYIFRKKLHERFSHKGSRNFITYAQRARKKFGNSETIKKQYKNSVEKIEKMIAIEKSKVELELKAKGKFKTSKR